MTSQKVDLGIQQNYPLKNLCEDKNKFYPNKLP